MLEVGQCRTGLGPSAVTFAALFAATDERFEGLQSGRIQRPSQPWGFRARLRLRRQITNGEQLALE